MKKCLLFSTLVAAVAMIASTSYSSQCSTTPQAKGCKSCCDVAKATESTPKKFIGKEAAIDVALKHAGKQRDQVRDLKCELDREKGVMVYEVEFEAGLFDYEYDIEASTGKILKSKKEFD